MKKLLVILMAVTLVGFCSAAFAAQVLPDEVLGELYAAQPGHGPEIDLDISKIDAGKKSAVAAQTNIAGLVVDGQANGSNLNLNQTNNATVLRNSDLSIAGDSSYSYGDLNMAMMGANIATGSSNIAAGCRNDIVDVSKALVCGSNLGS